MTPENPIAATQPVPTEEAIPQCKFCSLFRKQGSGTELDDEGMSCLTDRETQILEAMRRIRGEASRIKRRIRLIEEDLSDHPFERTRDGRLYNEISTKLWVQGMQDDWMNLNARLQSLRGEWRAWQAERNEAAEERMRLLGHEPA